MYTHLLVPIDGRELPLHAVDTSVALAKQPGVMVSHGRGALGEPLFGWHTRNVIARGRLPVLVLR